MDVYAVFPSRARFDGSSVHELRPGDESYPAPVVSVVYAPEGWTEVSWSDDLKVAVTGYARRTRAAVIA
jgi:hypothetical protein